MPDAARRESAMHFGASRFFLVLQWCVYSSGRAQADRANALFRLTIPSRLAIGTMVAASRHVKTKLNLIFAFAFGLLASLALPSGAAEAIVSAVAWVGDLRIAEFAVAANALTIVP